MTANTSEAMGELRLERKELFDRILVCPSCRGGLRREADKYVCPGCTKTYPIVDGIPRFLLSLSREERQVKQCFNLEHLRYRDSSHLRFSPCLVEDWLDQVRMPGDYFEGKLVLDAGCGSGRWTYALASLGARVVAVDFTEAGVAVTRQGTREFDNVAVVQADLLHLPFRTDLFDFVVSWGVLHHTPDTKAAMARLVQLVRKGGHLYVMIYEKHNPVKFFWTNLIRRVLQRLPEEQRYRLCRYLIIKNPSLYSLLRLRMICVPFPSGDDPLAVSTLQLGLYDAYSPAFNHLHTYDEVLSWFREFNFTDIAVTKPARFSREDDVRHYGAFGGYIHMKGIRG